MSPGHRTCDHAGSIAPGGLALLVEFLHRAFDQHAMDWSRHLALDQPSCPWIVPSRQSENRLGSRVVVQVIRPCGQCLGRDAVAGIASGETEGRPVAHVLVNIGRQPAEDRQGVIVQAQRRQRPRDRHPDVLVRVVGMSDYCSSAVRIARVPEGKDDRRPRVRLALSVEGRDQHAGNPGRRRGIDARHRTQEVGGDSTGQRVVGDEAEFTGASGAWSVADRKRTKAFPTSIFVGLGDESGEMLAICHDPIVAGQVLLVNAAKLIDPSFDEPISSQTVRQCHPVRAGRTRSP